MLKRENKNKKTGRFKEKRFKAPSNGSSERAVEEIDRKEEG